MGDNSVLVHMTDRAEDKLGTDQGWSLRVMRLWQLWPDVNDDAVIATDICLGHSTYINTPLRVS